MGKGELEGEGASRQARAPKLADCRQKASQDATRAATISRAQGVSARPPVKTRGIPHGSAPESQRSRPRVPALVSEADAARLTSSHRKPLQRATADGGQHRRQRTRRGAEAEAGVFFARIPLSWPL